MKRRAIEVRGTVQGVGFRPFVYGLAARLGLTGFVLNEAGGVRIEVEGEVGSLDAFMEELTTRPPPLARIEHVGWEAREPVGDRGFRIERSVGGGEGARAVAVSPDVGVCEDCLREMWDPGDRRYRYPFLNCTNCGPRLTIIRGVPYDRERTTMAGFAMCAACRAEYEDPLNRRFHAQPTACPVCGPRLSGADGTGRRVEMGDPLTWFAGAIKEGRIGGMKGLGGYHLVCDAGNAGAVAELRRRKGREEKPFAVMVRDVEGARRLCEVLGEERELLESVRRPIVLMRRHDKGEIAEGVAPGNPVLGVMLPYTPLHHLLMGELGGRVLVMTSGNRSDEPIAIGEPEVFERLAGVADFFLTHDRGIHVRCDDSVTRVMGSRTTGEEWTFGPNAKRSSQNRRAAESAIEKDVVSRGERHGRTSRPWHKEGKKGCETGSNGGGGQRGESVVRRSRGYAPEVTPLPVRCAVPVLAVGGQMKGTFALAEEGRAVVSHHLGDLDNFEAYRAFERDVELYERLLGIRPGCVAHDLHPDYASTRYALERAKREGIEVVGVQHHHAHVASCMVEHGLAGPVIGVSFDGTGFGTDGAVWGGEFLIADLRGFRRAGHLRYVAMPGGERAIREPWRMGVAYLDDAGAECGGVRERLRGEEVRVVRRMVERGINSPWTSSAGRLFDAVAAIVGVRDRVTFEGQAAMELEWVAAGKGHPGNVAGYGERAEDKTRLASEPAKRSGGSKVNGEYPFEIGRGSAAGSAECAPWVVDTRPLVREIVREVNAGVDSAVIARRFHCSVSEFIVAMCGRLQQETGIRDVVLSGGVFMNLVLTEEVEFRLRESGFCAFRHRTVPTNDGGISLGQVAIAACRSATGSAGVVEGVDRVPRDSGPSGQDVFGA